MKRGFDRLSLLETFIRIAERQSLSGAARDLGITQPSVSRQLVALEKELGTILAHRTTHELTLTSDGKSLLAEAHRMVGDWELLLERSGSTEQLSGEIKVVAPIALGQTLLAKAAGKFLASNPDVSLNWRVTDDPIRFGEEGCDCWFRVGPVPDQSLVVRKIATAERTIVAAPSVDCGEDSELDKLPWLTLAPYEADKIELTDEKGKTIGFRVQPRMRSDNILSLLECVVAGIGVAIMPRWLIGDLISSAELQEPFPSLSASSLSINIALPAGTRRPARVNAFVKSVGDELRLLI